MQGKPVMPVRVKSVPASKPLLRKLLSASSQYLCPLKPNGCVHIQVHLSQSLHM